jgi:uncharacterized protein YodC (DUF2158 family)
MTEKIVPGSIVILRSGSPKLTVEIINSDNKAGVSWFADGEYQFVTLPISALRLAQQPD